MMVYLIRLQYTYNGSMLSAIVWQHTWISAADAQSKPAPHAASVAMMLGSGQHLTA